MPLRDHFHPPFAQRYLWTSFHARWASAISDALNEQLPDNYNAQPNARFNIEIDVATLEFEPANSTPAPNWQPTAPVQTLPVVRRTDAIEVLIFSAEGPRLVGAIELVSPANKDREETRTAFVAKCVGILESGAGLIVVDIVTSRAASFHSEILTRFTGTEVANLAEPLYASAYRPIRAEEGGAAVQIWPHGLTLGQPLPTLPLWLTGGLPMRVDLNATYEETTRRLRLPPE